MSGVSASFKMVKNYLRLMMNEEGLDCLIISASAVEVLDNIDLEQIAHEWFKRKTRKIRLPNTSPSH